MEQKQPDPEIMAKFKKRFRLQLLVSIPAVLAAMGLMFLGASIEKSGRSDMIFVVPVGIGIIVGVLIFSLFNWRCPACNRYLGKGLPTFCRKCGAKLR